MMIIQVQDFKSEQYEEGYDGLVAAKAERAQKGDDSTKTWAWLCDCLCMPALTFITRSTNRTAQQRHQKALQDFAKKREEATKEGTYVIQGIAEARCF